MQCNGIQGKERATDIWSYLHLQTLLHWSWSWGETTNLSFKISNSCTLLARWVSVRPLVAHILKKIVSFFICCLTKFFTWEGLLHILNSHFLTSGLKPGLVPPTHITTFYDATSGAEIILCNTQSCTVQCQ